MFIAFVVKTFRDSLGMLCGTCSLLFAFMLARVWITGQFSTAQVRKFLDMAPDFILQVLPVDIDTVATATGRLTLCYEEPLALAMVSFWAISRGSDCVAGEMGRGTLEMIFAQPVSRISWLSAHVVVTIAGLVILVCVAWCGTWFGLTIFELEEPVSAKLFGIAAWNLGSLGFFLCGLSVLISCWDDNRSRVIGIVIAIYAVQLIQKLVGRVAPDEYVNLKRLGEWSFLYRFEPQILTNEFRQGSPDAWALAWEMNGTLMTLGLLGIALGALQLYRRDIAAPL